VKTEKNAATIALPPGRGKRVAVVSASFYGDLAAWLEDGARRGLAACGVAPDASSFHRVPGCFELPLASRLLIDTGRYDAIVALGVVVRGDTPHFDFVAGECSRGIMDVQLATRVPIGFGVLTTENLAQAEERADPARGDKGFEAAVAALSVLSVTEPV
jgi:6,7-dimethyl-8-ribityllumazine synthase